MTIEEMIGKISHFEDPDTDIWVASTEGGGVRVTVAWRQNYYTAPTLREALQQILDAGEGYPS